MSSPIRFTEWSMYSFNVSDVSARQVFMDQRVPDKWKPVSKMFAKMEGHVKS